MSVCTVPCNSADAAFSVHRFSFSMCGCVGVKLHTTLVALDLFYFLVLAVFGLVFGCGERDCSTQLTWMLCWGV